MSLRTLLRLRVPFRMSHAARRNVEQALTGRLKPVSKAQTLLFCTAHKCASSFAGRILTQLAAFRRIVPVDLDGYLHLDDSEARHRGAAEALRRHLQGDPAADGAALMETFFLTQGCFYGTFRSALAQAPHGCRTLLLLRDPRDILTSLYFSCAYSHAIPKNESLRERLLRERERVRNMPIDEYVVAQAPPYRDTFVEYCRWLQRPDVKLVKYENMVADFSGWLQEILDFWEIEPSRRQRRYIESLADFDVHQEDIHSHKRQVTPGDHLRKLQPATIAQLNAIFAEVLEPLGYQSDLRKSA